MSDKKHTVCVDLDGVLAQYSGWRGEEVIGDPVPGAVDFMARLRERYKVVVHTTRANTEAGLAATIAWLQKWGVAFDEVEGKPIAIAYVDDRAVNARPQDVRDGFENRTFEVALRRIAWLDTK